MQMPRKYQASNLTSLTNAVGTHVHEVPKETIAIHATVLYLIRVKATVSPVQHLNNHFLILKGRKF